MKTTASKPLLHIDIETYSKTDLGAHGVYRYTEDDSFRILLFAYAYDDEPVKIVDLDNGESLPENVLQDLTTPDVLKVAFNASFERICLSKFLGLPAGSYLNPDEWRCARAQSLYLGVGSASLKNIGLFLDVDSKKLEEGKGLISLFSVDQKTKKAANLYGLSPDDMRVKKHHEPEKWDLFKTYCKRDVEAEREIWDKAVSINEMPLREWQIYAMSERINDRGVSIDQDLIADVFEVMDAFTKDKLAECERIAPGLNVRSNAQMLEWLKAHGVDLSKCGKDTITDLAKSADGDVKTICQLRLAINKNSLGKYPAFLDVCCKDSRARGLFTYYGAHTGRWTSPKVNLHNQPRPIFDDLDEIRNLTKAKDYQGLEAKYSPASDALSSIIRTVIVSETGLSVCDYSAIEARIAPYLADENWQIEAFAKGEDIYCTTAGMMYGVPVEKNGANGHLRKLGKVAILGSNYGGGWKALKSMNKNMDEKELKTIVEKYRASVPNIVKAWSELDYLAKEAIRTKKRQDWKHGISFFMNGEHLLCELPCGRCICYPKARLENGEIVFHDIGNAVGERESRTYGGRLFENIVQSVARDCLCTTLLRLEQAGLSVIGHVHDEVLVEGSCLEQLKEIFAKPVPYLPGLQLKGEGFEGEYYRKD